MQQCRSGLMANEDLASVEGDEVFPTGIGDVLAGGQDADLAAARSQEGAGVNECQSEGPFARTGFRPIGDLLVVTTFPPVATASGWSRVKYPA